MYDEKVKINIRIPKKMYQWLKEKNDNISQEVNVALDEYKLHRSHETFTDDDMLIVNTILDLKNYCNRSISKKNKQITELNNQIHEHEVEVEEKERMIEEMEREIKKIELKVKECQEHEVFEKYYAKKEDDTEDEDT